MKKIAELLESRILYALSIGKIDQASTLRVILNTVNSIIEEDDDPTEIPTYEEAFRSILTQCAQLGLGAGDDENGVFKLKNVPLEHAQEKIQQCFAALRTYEAFHNSIFYTGQPLQHMGKPLDHTQMNEAFRLAQIALYEEPKIFLRHKWPYGGCELDEATPCNPFNCCELCQVPGAGHHTPKGA